MGNIKYLLLTVLLALSACSESEIESNSISSSNSTENEKLTLEEGLELIDELSDKTAVNLLDGEAIDIPTAPTVLEQHSRWYGVEAQKAKGETLEHYLAWVRCYQGLKYIGHGIYHPITIGQLIARLGDVDPLIPEQIHECARQQPAIGDQQNPDDDESPELVEIEKNEKSLNLSGEKLFFNIYLASKATQTMENRLMRHIAFGSTDSTYSDQKCHTLDEPIAHYAASLHVGHCRAAAKDLIQNSKYAGWPYLLDKEEKGRLGPDWASRKIWYNAAKIRGKKAQTLGLQGESE